MIVADPNNARRLVTDGAHEVRSQLAVILLELGRIDHARARMLEADVQTASETVNRIATLFRLTTDPPIGGDSVDLDALVHDLVRRVEQASPARARLIEVRKVGVLRPLQGHRASIAEAVRGLLDNAVRHTPPGTRIVLTVERSGGQGAAIRIDDDGPGLPAAVAERFAQPFAHGRVASAGVGLGLALSRQIARLHSGDLLQAGSPLGGACVTLTLGTGHPVAEAPAQPSRPEA
jgi:signal transduction histidine kinase